MPTSRLIGVMEIIVGTWRILRRNINLYGEFIVWFMAVGLSLWVIGYVLQRALVDQVTAGSVYTLCRLPALVVMVTITAAVIDATAKIIQRKRVTMIDSLNVGVHRFISVLWVSLLTSLIVFIGPVIAALVLYGALRWAHGGWSDVISYGLLTPIGVLLLTIPPAILLVRYVFASQFVVVDGMRGRMALMQSRLLVNGRWWKVFVRLAIPGMFFLLAGKLAIVLIYLLVGSIWGDPGMFFGTKADWSQISIAHQLFANLVPGFIYGLSIVVFTISHMLVWLDLKKAPLAK